MDLSQLAIDLSREAARVYSLGRESTRVPGNIRPLICVPLEPRSGAIGVLAAEQAGTNVAASRLVGFEDTFNSWDWHRLASQAINSRRFAAQHARS